MGPETTAWGGGLPREGVVVEKFVPSLESFGGLQGRNLGCPGNFAGMSRTPGGVKKVYEEIRAHFRSLKKRGAKGGGEEGKRGRTRDRPEGERVGKNEGKRWEESQQSLKGYENGWLSKWQVL